jgi:branched-subunit amino acid transport protein
MVEWSLIIYCGIVTFFSRFLMIAILKKEMFTNRIREVLSFVPSAIFPAIIFPAIFLDNTGDILLEANPKIFAAIIAIAIGLMSKNVIATIFSGLISYWLLIFIFNF